MKELRIKRNDPQLSEIQRGGLKAFEMLFRQYYAVLCAYGHKYVDFHDAEEIVQDSLLWIWENRENLTYIIHSGFISGYQNRYGDNLKPPTNVYHRMTA